MGGRVICLRAGAGGVIFCAARARTNTLCTTNCLTWTMRKSRYFLRSAASTAHFEAARRPWMDSWHFSCKYRVFNLTRHNLRLCRVCSLSLTTTISHIMRFRTLEIRWHDSKPISTCDFQAVHFKRARPPSAGGGEERFAGHSYRLATGGEDNHVRVCSLFFLRSFDF